jgi:hypothetical protein
MSREKSREKRCEKLGEKRREKRVEKKQGFFNYIRDQKNPRHLHNIFHDVFHDSFLCPIRLVERVLYMCP